MSELNNIVIFENNREGRFKRSNHPIKEIVFGITIVDGRKKGFLKFCYHNKNLIVDFYTDSHKGA